MKPGFRLPIHFNDSNIPVLSDNLFGVVSGTSGALKVSNFVVSTTTTTNLTINDHEDDDDSIF